MNRITKRLKERGNRKLLIPFFTVGFPDYRSSLDLVGAARDSGADFVELGIPFSDPLADGPEIQLSSMISLRSGTNIKHILKAVEAIRNRSEIPVILMGYYNPILAYGEERFFADASSSGVDGLIVPDLPVDEADRLKEFADSNSISTIFLVSPTSTDERIRLVERMSTDFVYAVTVTGVTGASRSFDTTTDRYLLKLKRTLHKPYVAGFGVSSAESARRLIRYSDGVVIGSALVRIITDAGSKREYLKQVSHFLCSIRKAI